VVGGLSATIAVGAAGGLQDSGALLAQRPRTASSGSGGGQFGGVRQATQAHGISAGLASVGS
jgi:cysteine sulfinate desulfinase/cysteine desulfurase-like protein